MSGGGHNISAQMANDNCGSSFWRDEHIPIDHWRRSDWTVPTTTAGAEPYFASYSQARVLRWRQDAGTANILRWHTSLPGDYDPDADQLQLLLALRKYDTAADENPDLRMLVTAYWFNLGEVNPLLGNADVPGPADMLTGPTALSTAAVSRTLPAASSQFAFRWFAFDFSFRTTRSATQRLKPGASVWFTIGPNEQVGATDMGVEMIASAWRYRSHATLRSLLARDRRRIYTDAQSIGNT